MKNDVMAALAAVEPSREALEGVVGVADGGSLEGATMAASAGWVCTLSGECNASGGSCNPF